MNAEQAAHLCKLAKTISPAQAIEEFTPAAWALILEDVRFEDAREALKQLGGEQEWIHVSHIVKRVKKIRNDRVSRYLANIQPPSGMTDAEYGEWQRRTIRQVADGDLTPEPPQAVEGKRNVIRELGQAQSVNAADAVRDLRTAHAEARRELQEAAAEEKRQRDEERAERERKRKADREAREAMTTTTARCDRQHGDLSETTEGAGK